MGVIPYGWNSTSTALYIFVILSLKLKKNIVIAFVWKMLQKTAPNDILTQPE